MNFSGKLSPEKKNTHRNFEGLYLFSRVLGPKCKVFCHLVRKKQMIILIDMVVVTTKFSSDEGGRR